jgi:hypothetical protein
MDINGHGQHTNLDTERDEGGELPLLEVGNGAPFSSGLALARCSGFLERVSSRGLGAGVTEITRGRTRSNRVFRLLAECKQESRETALKCAQQ